MGIYDVFRKFQEFLVYMTSYVLIDPCTSGESNIIVMQTKKNPNKKNTALGSLQIRQRSAEFGIRGGRFQGRGIS